MRMLPVCVNFEKKVARPVRRIIVFTLLRAYVSLKAIHIYILNSSKSAHSQRDYDVYGDFPLTQYRRAIRVDNEINSTLRPQKSCSFMRNIITYRFNYVFPQILLHARSSVKRNPRSENFTFENALNVMHGYLLLTIVLTLPCARI